MVKQGILIRILLIEDEVEDAEQIVSMLRNGAIPVRPTRAENDEQLLQQINSGTFDLVLANPAAKSPSFKTAVECIVRSGKDLPILATVSSTNESEMLRVYQKGAHSAAFRDQPEHVQHVVKREYANVVTRRQVRKLELSLKESERRCDALLDSSRDPIAFVHEGMHVRANKPYLEMFGFDSFDEIEGMPILEFVSPSHADSFKGLLKGLSKGEKPPGRIEIQAVHPDGNAFSAIIEIAEASYEGEPCLQLTFRRQEISGELALEVENLRQLDLVTGLLNRQFFLTELDRAVAEAASGQNDISLLLIDPDQFRGIQESIGLGNTDLILRDVASVLREFTQPEDVLGRLADSRFALIVMHQSHEDTIKRAHAIRKAFEDRVFEAGSRSLSIQVSVGGVLIGEKIAQTEKVLQHASDELSRAAEAGGNRVCVYDPGALEKLIAVDEGEKLAALKVALRNNGLFLVFQPIVSLNGGDGEFFEVLVRMKEENGGYAPALFFPVAERNGLLPAIDRWVIAAAIKALAERENEGFKTTFFVKLTPEATQDSTLLPWIAQHLKTARLRGDALVFEIPESKVVTNLKSVRDFQRGLAQLHCGFALEQFGSGLNSFQLLKHVDAQYLKLDRLYMADLAESTENQQKVRELCQQANKLSKLTVAEFVEDAASVSILFSCGVHFVQGNFLQEPEKIMAYEANVA